MAALVVETLTSGCMAIWHERTIDLHERSIWPERTIDLHERTIWPERTIDLQPRF
jgi:lambda repressor-like predicted transcriptional regulator